MKKNIKQLLALLLAGLMLITLAACGDKEDPAGPDPSTDSQAPDSGSDETDPSDTGNGEGEGEGEGEQQTSNMTAKKLYAGRAGVKILGVRNLADEDRIYLDWPGSGIEIALNNKGSRIVFTVNGSGAFRVWVDGTAWKNTEGSEIFTTDSGPRIMLEGVSAGDHVIRIVKINDYDQRADIPNVVFDGALLENTPADRDYYVEFIGDESMLDVKDTEEKAAKLGEEDNTAMLPYLAAMALNADYSILARKGTGLVAGSRNATSDYLYTSKSVDETELYDFARKPDAIVVNLGGADETTDTDAFLSAYMDMIFTLREKNGDGCKIYCVYTADNAFRDVIVNVCDSLGGDAAGLYAVELSGETQQAMADTLVAKINETKDAAITERPKRAGHGTVVDWSEGVAQNG